jgi:hypothetical protein
MHDKIDIIELLLDRGLTDLCFQIFSELECNSFANSRSVCQSWRQFVDHYFFKTPKGKRWLRNNIKVIFHVGSHTPDCVKEIISSNILNVEYEPSTTTTFQREETRKINVAYNCFEDKGMLHIEADEESICVSVHGSICNYKFHTLEHLWTLTLTDECVTHCMNKERVFVAPTSGEEGHVFIVDRSSGQLLHTLLNVHPMKCFKNIINGIFGFTVLNVHPMQCDENHINGIYRIQVFSNKILATSDSCGYLKFHRIDELKSKVISTIETKNRLIFQEEIHEGGYLHLDHDSDKLVGMTPLKYYNF